MVPSCIHLNKTLQSCVAINLGNGIRVIKDPEVAKLFADETRRHILHILRHHERSATDLAKALKKNHSSIVHHLHHLKEAGLIEETRTEQVRNLVQPYYRSVAGRFMVSYSLSEALAEDDHERLDRESRGGRTLREDGLLGASQSPIQLCAVGRRQRGRNVGPQPAESSLRFT